MIPKVILNNNSAYILVDGVFVITKLKCCNLCVLIFSVVDNDDDDDDDDDEDDGDYVTL